MKKDSTIKKINKICFTAIVLLFLLTSCVFSGKTRMQAHIDTPVRDKDLLRKVPIAYSFQCARAVPLAYSRRNSMQLMPHKDS